MNPHPAALPRRRSLLPAATLLALCALLSAAGVARAEEAPTPTPILYTNESVPQYQSQLANGQIAAVTINKRVRSLRVTLKNGDHVLVKYAPHQEPGYAAALRAKGLPVRILTPEQASSELKNKPVHHKLRYIAGGILLVVLIIVGVVLFVNRRRKAIVD